METTLYVNGIRGRMGQTLAALIEMDSSLGLQENFEAATVAVDFSSPAALNSLLQRCAQHQKPLVIGTTGHPPSMEKTLQAAAQHIPILYSPNFSLGLAVCLEAAHLIARNLKGLCHIEIVEAHHQTKKDKPSGTALALAKAVDSREIPIHSIRAGDIIGEHTVFFVLAGERIELRHHVQSREAFARGALLAAKFIKTQPPGLYSIKDLFYAPRQS